MSWSIPFLNHDIQGQSWNLLSPQSAGGKFLNSGVPLSSTSPNLVCSNLMSRCNSTNGSSHCMGRAKILGVAVVV